MSLPNMKQVAERIQLLNDKPENKNGKYVLYWMQMYKRATHNHALNFAVELANDLKLPLVVYEGLKFYYPWASDRLHTFILEGVAEKQAEFSERGIRYVFYLQRNERDPKHTVADLARDAALLVTDDYPCFIIPEHNERVAQLNLPVYAVDANGMVPLPALPKEEYAAYKIRPKIQRLLPDLPRSIVTPHIEVQNPALTVECPETNVTAENIAELVTQCDIDHTVEPSTLYHGGTKAGRKRLKHFVSNILPHYDKTHNEPSFDGVSRLSPYLHFGF